MASRLVQERLVSRLLRAYLCSLSSVVVLQVVRRHLRHVRRLERWLRGLCHSWRSLSSVSRLFGFLLPLHVQSYVLEAKRALARQGH